MRRIALVLMLSLLAPLRSGALDEDPDSPHVMVKPDGETDMDKCLVCHADDMSLSQGKVETCTACHSLTTHAGAADHISASSAAVSRVIGEKKVSLPLTDDGRIYCGTCHVFHDPRVSDEAILSERWVPSNTGVSKVVKESLLTRWQNAAHARGSKEPGASFSERGTLRLRSPINDGSLCRNCHRYGE